jgi:hypothetical protein
MDCVHYWEVGPWGGGGAPTGLIAPGATHPRYATAFHCADAGHNKHVHSLMLTTAVIYAIEKENGRTIITFLGSAVEM